MKFIKHFLVLVFVVTNQITFSQSARVTLKGSVSDSSIKFINIKTSSPLWKDNAKETVITQQIISKQSAVQIDFLLPKPTWLSFQILGKSIKIYSNPGDDLRFEINRKVTGNEIRFNGKNSVYYNYDSESADYVFDSLKTVFPTYNISKPINKYLDEIIIWKELKLHFLNTYVRNNKISKKFEDYCIEEINSGYAYLFYIPFAEEKTSTQNDLMPTTYNKFSNSSFDTRINHISYLNLMAYSYKNILCYKGNPYSHFDEIYNKIQHDFKGIISEYLTSNLIGIFAKHGSESYKALLLNTIEKSKLKFQDSTCLKYISNCELEYTILNRPLSEDVLMNTFLEDFSSSNKISLKDLLAKFPDKPIYFDFWANWCGACRIDIANSEQSKKYMDVKNIIYIYLSIDKEKDKDKWHNASNADKITDNQYLLLNNTQSRLAKLLKLREIPRYILFDSQHNLKSFDAPRPIPNQFNDLKWLIATTLGPQKKANSY